MEIVEGEWFLMVPCEYMGASRVVEIFIVINYHSGYNFPQNLSDIVYRLKIFVCVC